METTSVSNLKTHLSAELKRVRAGVELVIVDHQHPVARLVPLADDGLFVREAVSPYAYSKLEPLTTFDPLVSLDAEREDSW